MNGLLVRSGFDLLPRSLVSSAGVEWGLARAGSELRIVAAAPRGASVFGGFEGEVSEGGGGSVLAGPTTPKNAQALRTIFPWLVPVTLGCRTSAGLGDRLGLATPGHIRAIREAGGGIAPVFAQQSIREMARTGRTPQQVIDDAMWGVFAEGWRDGFGADADHLKQPQDIDACVAAGFTQFTIDPGEHVNASVDALSEQALADAVGELPWHQLEDSFTALRRRFVGRRFDLDGLVLAVDEHALASAAVKYGRAVAHVAAMWRHLLQAAAGRTFELEISVDETDEPTSHVEHVYIASELRRLGVRWVGLAPRFVGRFEKGVDYIGDLGAFESHYAGHASIARALGPYKLSLHSGSDKFSIYPLAAAHARGLVHLKTAGTSYLEALRTAAALEPALFREVYQFARERYDTERASYHVSADPTRAPDAAHLPGDGLGALLDDFHTRQILHVTFGSVLTALDRSSQPRFAGRLRALLTAHPETYAENLELHFARHLRPFAVPVGGRGS